MRVWITGATGMLGSALAETLQQQGVPFVASTRQEADLTSLPSLLQFYQSQGPFTHLFHTAAYTNVDLAEVNQDDARRANGLGSALMGLIAAEQGCKLVAVSTDYVFDGAKRSPYLECDAAWPQNVYGKTKLEGEERLLSICPDACVARTSWLFGKGSKHFVSTMVRLMKEREEVLVVADQQGRPTYAPDLAKWLWQLRDSSGTVHLANREETTWFEFANAIYAELLARGVPLRCSKILPLTTAEYNARAKRPLYSVLDTSKAERYVTLRSWREGLYEWVGIHATT